MLGNTGEQAYSVIGSDYRGCPLPKRAQSVIVIHHPLKVLYGSPARLVRCNSPIPMDAHQNLTDSGQHPMSYMGCLEHLSPDMVAELHCLNNQQLFNMMFVTHLLNLLTLLYFVCPMQLLTYNLGSAYNYINSMVQMGNVTSVKCHAPHVASIHNYLVINNK